MATNYGGQMADAFTKGLQGGYGFVDKAVTSKQNRDNAQRVADQKSKVAEQQIRAREAIEAETQQNGSIAPADQTKIDTADTALKAENANKSAVAVTGIVGATTQEENDDAFANANTVVSSNPAIQALYAMKPGDQIEQLDLSKQKDDYEFTKHMGNLGVTPESMGYDIENDLDDKAAWDALKKDMQPLLSMGKVNDNYLSMEDLSVVTKADARVPADQKKKVKANKTVQETTVKKAKHTQLDKKLVEAQRQLLEKGIKLDTSGFKTVEQKQKALDDAEDKLYRSAFTNVSDEDKAIGVKPTSVPKTMVMGEDGEFREAKNGDPTNLVTKAEDGTITTKTDDGSKVTQKPTEEKGITENIVTKPDGTKVTTVTKDQDIGTDSKAPKNPEEVEKGIQLAKESSKPMDETRMRHLYALAGMTYPIPDKGAKIKQYEFLVANGLDEKTAMSWTFEPSSKTGVGRKPTSYEEASKAFILGKQGTPTKTEWEQFNSDWATKSTGGVKDVRDQRDLNELNRNFADVSRFKAKYLTKPNDASRADLGVMKGIEQSNFQNSPAIKERTKNTVKDMELRHRTVNGLNSLLGDLDGTIKNSTRGPIENSWQTFKKIVGGDNFSAEQKASMKSTMERDTRTGMILAEFLRMTSGLAVTQDEREFLTDVMTGGNWSDEKSLLKALSTFRDQTVEQNDVIAGTLINDAPYSATVYRQYDTYDKADSQRPTSGGSTNTKSTTRNSKLNIKDFL